MGRPAEPEAQAAPCPRPTAPPAAVSPRLGRPFGRPHRVSAPAGQATRTEGPGPGGIWGPSPQEIRPLAAAGTREPGAPQEEGSRRGERAGRSPGPGNCFDPPRAGDAEDPGIPRRHSGPSAGLTASDRPGSAPRGETAPAPRTRPQTGPRIPARSPPRARSWASGRCGNRERRTERRGARGTPELGRGAQGSDVRAPGPLSS